MSLKIFAKVGNESFARSCVAAFAAKLNPSVDQIDDIKTAVSEAVTNSIVHANLSEDDLISIDVSLDDSAIHITISDEGVGIDDVDKARRPFYTTKTDQERSGLGFTLMDAFMDSLDVKSSDSGVCVKMTKNILNISKAS